MTKLENIIFQILQLKNLKILRISFMWKRLNSFKLTLNFIFPEYYKINIKSILDEEIILFTKEILWDSKIQIFEMKKINQVNIMSEGCT